MPGANKISERKKKHIELCLSNDVAFKNKTNGFDHYEFIHDAATQVNIKKINFETEFFKKKINYPFFISCMTGGTSKAGNINEQLSVAARQLNIPLGVGSQRQALENKTHHQTYKIIRKNAPKIPILGNIGAAQIVRLKSFKEIEFLIDLIEADAMVVHLNPAHELFQDKGDVNFIGIFKKLEGLVKSLNIPVIIKEVGNGISKNTAEKLLKTGIHGIDVAGAGGTSWTGVEILRNGIKNKEEFWDWGLPTSFCLKEVNKLKKKFNFILIGSGGINNSFDMGKAFALGSDLTASARKILQTLNKSGSKGVVNLIETWFDDLKKILFLTGSNSIKELKKNKLIKKEEIY